MDLVKHSSFTCITCRVGFKDPEIQRLHYKSDWHRYNLKRKVAELPPVNSEDFQFKVLNQRNLNEALQQNSNVYCHICKKNYGNSNAYNNHLNSKKHKDNEKSFNPSEQNVTHHNSVNKNKSFNENNVLDPALDSDSEELSSDEWEDINTAIESNDCLFCTHHSRNFISNLEHITSVHSFFIPDIEYCINMEGLLGYLYEKVTCGFMCLWCNEKGRTFHSADAARKHMIDKGHCKMLYEGIALAEYADFYDYSSSYEDADNEDINPDEDVNVAELDGSDYQLVLPSGITVGHRSLMRYYKQSLNPNKALAVSNNNNKKLHKVLAKYRALGWTAAEQESVVRKARDIHYMKRLQSKYMTKLGIKNNKLQKHFRQQVNF
ncbi:cytoplasmic 60S subunit biogenesis factor ZNF622-like [Cylas formicarius]|uniref:cytoplasmic 60S subunit biogenesis factor ZNF622-like n=1 Tax=Cylas formicarius TaxID=197179 RepID=UPI002958B8D9|nr:cytoplasmic 60S subunit biogenesis factor ZNF622-like [Cylas formicarius]